MIDYLQRFHTEMWPEQWAMVGCCVAFVFGVELAAWGGRKKEQ